MFPLPDFMKRHGTPIKRLDEKTMTRLFPGGFPQLNSSGAAVFAGGVPNEEGGYFEIAQSGSGERGIWRASIVILPDSLTAILVEHGKEGHESGVVTICLDTIVSARFVPGLVQRADTHGIIDE